VKVEAIVLQVGDRQVELPKRSISEFQQRQPFLDRIRHWAVMFPVILATVTVAHIFFKLDDARTKIETQLSELQGRAKSARQTIDQRNRSLSSLDSVRRLKSDRIPVGAAWGELSRVLPDNAWLTDFSVNSSTVMVSGFADQASLLVAPLDASPLFARPVFVGATSKLPGHNGEHFDMRLEIERP